MAHLLLAVVLGVLAIVPLVRLARMVQLDRPVTPPRSHAHELDPVALRLTTWP